MSPAEVAGKMHVPYRDSKLTHILSDSLGGDSKTLMFLHIGPALDDVPETLCSLDFGQRVCIAPTPVRLYRPPPPEQCSVW
eukprot:8288712-Pyramimonas_sp.AAC.1